MYNWFFNKKGDQKKWFVLFSVFVPLLIGVFFGIWGINLTMQSNNNKDQIDALTQMVREMKKQNEYTQRPILAILELSNNFIGEAMSMEISIDNSGGDIYDLIATSIKGAEVDSVSLPVNRQIPSLRSIRLNILNIKEDGSGIRLTYRNSTMDQYTQDIIWFKQEGSFNMLLGAQKSVKNE